MRGKIGIIRALLYYRYGFLFVNFFKHLGIEYLLSPKTNRELIDLGVKNSSSEVCLPLKVACGHLLYLKDKVDYLFVPKIIYPYGRLYTCPKMMGLPTIALYLCGKEKVISPTIKGNFFLPLFFLGLKFRKNPLKIVSAYLKARRKEEKKELVFDNKNLKIAIISHFYNIYDEEIGSFLIETFKKEGFSVYLKDDLDEKILKRKEGFAKNIRWAFERELYNAFKYYLDKVDGICFFFSFACGPDSLIGEMMAKEAKEKGIPFLTIIFDEHSGKEGIITRIEAFCEMIKRKKR
ncbi:MAG: acyl-CoA dehydratase activase-related protein [candidate division WOR-3 bacterium]|nr:acyl-CoA dehydratase activase-related protein [candidate division WOR-3 bacterium]MDW8113670.1 acyl-CoA dehydratase activase-related protein [candidate division WOR-3 bacterium]